MKDRNAAVLIRLGGWTVLAALVLILWHLLSVIVPIFSAPTLENEGHWTIPQNQRLLLLTEDVDGVLLVTQTERCGVEFSRLRPLNAAGQLATSTLGNPRWRVIQHIPYTCDKHIAVMQQAGKYYLAELGRTGMLRVFEVLTLAEQVVLQHQFSHLLAAVNSPELVQLQLVQYPHNWAVVLQRRSVTGVLDSELYWLHTAVDAKPSRYVYPGAKHVVVAKQQRVFINFGHRLEYRDATDRLLWQTSSASGIASMTLFPSANAIALLERNGAVSKWAFTNDRAATELTRRYLLSPPPTTTQTSVAGIGQQTRHLPGDLGQVSFHPQTTLALLTSGQRVVLFNSVTGELLAQHDTLALFGAALFDAAPLGTAPLGTDSNASTEKSAGESLSLFWLDRGFALVSATDAWRLHISHSSAVLTLSTLFGAIHYQGYDGPEYIWQSSAGNDAIQPKYSIIPLVIGSVKAAVLALLIAIPTGLGAAVYTAYFATTARRKWLKPTIEMLEAIPSVMIGFIAAVWLLPLSAEQLASAISFLVLLPVFGAVLVWCNAQLLRRFSLRLPLTMGWCFLYLLAFAFSLSGAVPWVLQTLSDMQVPALFFPTDQDTHSKNTVVVAIALGIAIAPSVYSLAEDAIFEVPVNLKRAAYALGASQLQTLTNVVLKVAFPGILSAAILGFSRAVGETMILLMVTGNTPMAEWDLTAGMRTLTANLAIELPESEVASSHYGALFVTAFLLLAFTMLINTVAELLRLRFRRRYRHD